MAFFPCYGTTKSLFFSGKSSFYLCMASAMTFSYRHDRLVWWSQRSDWGRFQDDKESFQTVEGGFHPLNTIFMKEFSQVNGVPVFSPALLPRHTNCKQMLAAEKIIGKAGKNQEVTGGHLAEYQSSRCIQTKSFINTSHWFCCYYL